MQTEMQKFRRGLKRRGFTNMGVLSMLMLQPRVFISSDKANVITGNIHACVFQGRDTNHPLGCVTFCLATRKRAYKARNRRHAEAFKYAEVHDTAKDALQAFDQWHKDMQAGLGKWTEVK